MAVDGDEWDISIPELAQRIGDAQARIQELGPYSGIARREALAMQTVLDARVQLEAAERLGVAAVRADEAAVESAKATQKAAEAAEGTRKATVALAWVTGFLALAGIAQVMVALVS